MSRSVSFSLMTYSKLHICACAGVSTLTRATQAVVDEQIIKNGKLNQRRRLCIVRPPQFAANYRGASIIQRLAAAQTTGDYCSIYGVSRVLCNMYFFGGRVIQPPRPNGTEKSIGSIGALGMTPAQAEKHLKGSHPATNTGHK